MAISVETGKAAPDGPTARPERREAGARQDRWMSELERAMLGMMANKPAESAPQGRAMPSDSGQWRSLGAAAFVQPHREAGSDHAAAPRPSEGWQERDAAERDSSPSPELAPAQRTVHGAAAQAPGAGAGPDGQGAAGAAPARRALPPPAQGAPAGVAKPGAQAMAAVPGGAERAIDAAGPAHGTAALPMASAALQDAAPQDAGASASAPRRAVPALAATAHADGALRTPGASSAEADDGLALALLPPVSQGAVAAIVSAIAAAEADGPGAARVIGTAAGAPTPQSFQFSRAMTPAPAQPQPAAPALESPEIAETGPAGADGDAGPAPSFEKRALHVFLARDGVHAWLRDADLQAAQLRAVVQALAAEVAGTGKTLAGLTVNGKPVDPRLLPGAAGRDDQDLLTMDGDGDFAATPTYLQPRSPKGNPAP